MAYIKWKKKTPYNSQKHSVQKLKLVRNLLDKVMYVNIDLLLRYNFKKRNKG
jgi:hypothetical protein